MRVIVHEALCTYVPLVSNKGSDPETWELFRKLDAQKLEKICSVLSSSPPNIIVNDLKNRVDPKGSDERNDEKCMSDGVCLW